MPIMFNTLLREAGLSLSDIRLIRHKDKSSLKGRSPYELWRENRSQFELYQSTQRIPDRKKFMAPFWAVFVVTFSNETLFAGLYHAKYKGLLKQDTPRPHKDGVDKAGTCDYFDLRLQETLSDLIGRLIIDWGLGALAWVQHADRNNKPIIEIRKTFYEPEFPGFLNFILPLSKLNSIPLEWKNLLKNSKGVYLLTCPKTREQYVGSASGIEGFWGRWINYIHSGHGE